MKNGVKEKQNSADKQLAYIPGAEPSARIDAGWWLVLLALVTVILLVLVSPTPYLDIVLFVRDGIWITILVTVISFVLTLGLGLLGALGRLSNNKVISGIATLYVELIRGIPLLVQLIWWYFAFPVVVQNLGNLFRLQFLIEYQANALLMAILGMTFCYGAYLTEIYRAGIQSIPKGQTEAAKSLGMNYFQSMRYIILPQAIRVVLPPVGNEFISMLKDSSLVSVVAVADLTRRGREYMSSHFNPIEVWSIAALIYLLMTLLSARVVAAIEKNTRTTER
jgi:polar amino acid transport system permease protein